MAQGLKPSSKPSASVNSGKPIRDALRVPKRRVSTLLGATVP